MRIVFIPIILVIILTRLKGMEHVALGLFLLVAVSDWLDGYIARKRGQTTHFGAFLDPLADKLLVTSIFIAFVELKLAPAWMVAIIVARELVVTAIRGFAALESFVMKARMLGKIKMLLQIICISSFLLSYRMEPFFRIMGRATLIGVVILSLISMGDYLLVYYRWYRHADVGEDRKGDRELSTHLESLEHKRSAESHTIF